MNYPDEKHPYNKSVPPYRRRFQFEERKKAKLGVFITTLFAFTTYFLPDESYESHSKAKKRQAQIQRERRGRKIEPKFTFNNQVKVKERRTFASRQPASFVPNESLSIDTRLAKLGSQRWITGRKAFYPLREFPSNWTLPLGLDENVVYLETFLGPENESIKALVEIIDEVDLTFKVRIAHGQDLDFSQVTPHIISRFNSKIPQGVDIEVPLKYGTKGRHPYHIHIEAPSRQKVTSLTFNSISARTSVANIDGTDYQLFLYDQNVDGRYDDVKNTVLILHEVSEGRAKIYRKRGNTPLKLEEKSYSIYQASPLGDSLVLGPSRFGKLIGKVQHLDESDGVIGAEVRLNPGNIVLRTKTDGTFEADVPEGTYSFELVKAHGMIPDNYLGKVDVDPFVKTTLHPFSLKKIDQSKLYGETILKTGRGFHFLAGKQTNGRQGDLYISRQNQFTTYSKAQRKIASVGSQPVEFLINGKVPPAYEFQDKAQIIPGHTYVLRPRMGEEGHHVFFRVEEVADNRSIKVRYQYR